MDGVGGYAGWRWIFILEGLLTVVIAFVAPFAIYDSPEKATFLTKEEREWVIATMRRQARVGETAPEEDEAHAKESSKYRTKYVWDALKDWQIYVGLFSMSSCTVAGIEGHFANLCCAVYWGITCPLYGISFFLPSIIKDLGYTSSTAQLLTVPIYITAAVVAVVGAWLSDRRQQRSPFILFFMSLIAFGFIIVIASSGRGVPGVVYFGVFLAVVGKSITHPSHPSLQTTLCLQHKKSSLTKPGIYPAFPGNVTWLSVNLAGDYKRAAGMAIHIGVGNLSGGKFAHLSCDKKAANDRVTQPWHRTSIADRTRRSISLDTRWSLGSALRGSLRRLFCAWDIRRSIGNGIGWMLGRLIRWRRRSWEIVRRCLGICCSGGYGFGLSLSFEVSLKKSAVVILQDWF